MNAALSTDAYIDTVFISIAPGVVVTVWTGEVEEETDIRVEGKGEGKGEVCDEVESKDELEEKVESGREGDSDDNVKGGQGQVG